MMENKARYNGYRVLFSRGFYEFLEVTYKDIPSFEARPVRIGEFCDKAPALPLSMQPVNADTSRFLDALEKKHMETVRHQTDAISFSSLRRVSSEKEENGNV